MKDFLKGIFLICVIGVCACIIIWQGFAKPTFLSAKYSCDANKKPVVPAKVSVFGYQIFNFYNLHLKYLGYECKQND